jgi:leucyl aminopeptidase
MMRVMKPLISLVKSVSSDQSLVFITGNDEIPEFLNLSPGEKEYAHKRLRSGEFIVYINAYNRQIYIVKTKDDKSLYKIREGIRRSAYKLKKLIRENNHSELVISASGAYEGAVIDFAEGFLLSIYSFRKYKTKSDDGEKSSYPDNLLLHGEISDDDVKCLTELTDAIYFSRDLINEPVNHLNAVTLATEIRKRGDQAGFNVEIFNKGKIEALKMGGLLAVNKGSVDPPSFSIMEWKPAGHLNKKPVVLVGKGIVYDTGGLNIKTGDSMSGMKSDMAGAAIITGVMYTAAKTNLPVHLVGLVPSTDNRPGGNAYTQGDVITMHNGKTVEVANTDAEGRLILADAISYSKKYDPELIINIATLTGSAAVTFSHQAIAVMANAEKRYLDLLEESGNEVYERIATLPLWDEYGEMLKSDIADMKNVSGVREAGAITAGKFLEKFAEAPFIHLDIAGTEYMKKDDYYKLKNGSATGLRLIYTFLKKMADKY